jgi:hypothetical protein
MPIQEEEDWVTRSKQENAILFSELDILLRALDRYFNIENLTFSDSATGKNFFEELVTVRTLSPRAQDSGGRHTGKQKKCILVSEIYRDKISPASKIDAFRKDLYRQDTPEKGLYLLYDSFINIKTLITDLLRTGNISYMGFTNIGRLISKEIRENTFFNPFRKNLNSEFDIISNAVISGTVKSLTDREEKKQISIIYIYLFRLLRILSFVEITTQRSVSLHSSLMILILLRSEISAFRSHMEKTAQKVKNPDLQGFFMRSPISLRWKQKGLPSGTERHQPQKNPYISGKD